MRKDDWILIVILSFLIGMIVCYISCQFIFLDIDFKVNVVDGLISFAGLCIGLYIAIIFQNNKNRGQNFYSFVETKFDKLWQDFILLNETLDYTSQIELREISKKFKSLDQKTAPLKKIFEAFDYDKDCILEIENKIEDLEKFISEIEQTTNNVINLDSVREKLTEKLNEINETFANSYKKINQIS